MKKLIVVFLFVFVFVVSCVPQKDARFCVTDSDCVCGGVDKVSKNCFVGNKLYYESGSVDKSKACPDFCTGIAGNLLTKCVEHKCVTVSKNSFVECSSNEDCLPSDCFHASSCVSKDQAPKCADVFGTQECRQGTLDCGGFCSCESKHCVAKNLYKSSFGAHIV